jgi:hypothetical protein
MEVCKIKLHCLCYMAELMQDCCRINHDMTVDAHYCHPNFQQMVMRYRLGV